MRKLFIIFTISLVAVFVATSTHAQYWANKKKAASKAAAKDAQPAPSAQAIPEKEQPAESKIKMSDIPKYSPKEELAILREINKELEAYLPQLKERNVELKARIDDIEKKNIALSEEVDVLKKEKGCGENKEVAELKRQNEELQAKLDKVAKEKEIVASALKDQQTIIAEEVEEMRKENESLFAKVAELKKLSQKN